MGQSNRSAGLWRLTGDDGCGGTRSRDGCRRPGGGDPGLDAGRTRSARPPSTPGTAGCVRVRLPAVRRPRPGRRRRAGGVRAGDAPRWAAPSTRGLRRLPEHDRAQRGAIAGPQRDPGPRPRAAPRHRSRRPGGPGPHRGDLDCPLPMRTPTVDCGLPWPTCPTASAPPSCAASGSTCPRPNRPGCSAVDRARSSRCCRAAWPRYGRRSPMDEPKDLEARLAAMAHRRVAAADQPSELPARSRRRIRRGERVGAALATMLVVAMVAGGVALARADQDRATTVRVAQAPAAAPCYPTRIPRALADQVRSLAREGTAVAGSTPRAFVVAGALSTAPVTVADPGRTAWEVVVSGEHFVPSYAAPGFVDRAPHQANSESWNVDASLMPVGSSIPGPTAADLDGLDPVAVSLDPSCAHNSSDGTIPPASSTSSTETSGTSPRHHPVDPPDRNAARLHRLAALPDRVHQQVQLPHRRHGDHRRDHPQRRGGVPERLAAPRPSTPAP